MASKADIIAAQTTVKVGMDKKDWARAIGSLEHDLKVLSRRINAIGRSMMIGGIMAATPLVAGAKAYADFSKQMGFVATMLDKPIKYMAEYNRSIKELSVLFGESTEALSRGLYDILSATFSADKAIHMLTITTSAAKAGMTDAANSSRAIIAVLNAYGMSAEHAAYVSDILFTIVRYGVITFEELAGHIGLLAPTAAIANVKLEELAALIATVTRAGIEGSHTIVALNNMLKQFIKPSKEAARIAHEHGIELSIATIQGEGLIKVLMRIFKLPKKTIGMIFPEVRAQRAVFTAFMQMKGLVETLDHMYHGAGATQRALDQTSKTFGYLIDQVKAGAQIILVDIGQAISGSLRNVGEWIMTIALGLHKWIRVNKELVVTYMKIVGRVIFWGVVLMGVAKITAVILGLISAIRTAIVAGTGGLLGLLGGLATFGALLVPVIMGLNKIKAGFAGIRDEGLETYRKLERERAKALKQVTRLGLKEEERAEAEKRLKEIAGEMVKAEDLVIKCQAGYNRALEKAQKLRKEMAEDRARRGVILPFLSRYGRPSAKEEAHRKKVLRITLQQLHYYERRFAALQDEAKAIKKNIELSKEQKKVLQEIAESAGTVMGYYAGYWRTPTRLSEQRTGETRQLEALHSIRDNTAMTVEELERINTLAPAT